MNHKSVAIACQGGGSHCAFGAGVLLAMMDGMDEVKRIVRGGVPYRIMGLSGTSGGAINALLGWYGLVHPDGPAAGVRALRGFWQAISARTPWDYLTNLALVNAVRLRGVLPQLEVAPGSDSDHAQEWLATLIEQQVAFERLPQYVGADSAELLIGAADVLAGTFEVFRADGSGHLPTVRQVLASTAVPELYRPVQVDGRYYWDGLLSQNPPVRDFLRGRPASETPDEIWVIRINPIEREGVPSSVGDILDRRNEMAGNISLEQECYFIGRVNDWVARGLLPADRYKHVEVRDIPLGEKGRDDDGLDYASKLDRRLEFIESLLRRGEAAGRAFLGE